MDVPSHWKEKYAFKRVGFASNHPEWPRRPMDLHRALTHTYIRTNPDNLTSMLVVDVDVEDAERFILSKAWDDNSIPEPNWVTTNLVSSHAHAGYWLSAPVSTSNASSVRASRFAYDIQRKLTVALSGDYNYTNHLTRSPFSLGHTTRIVREDGYSLKELASNLSGVLIPTDRKIRTAEGRNLELFDKLRSEAYRLRIKGTPEGEFKSLVLDYGLQLNNDLSSHPLALSEVRSISRSISKWAWRTLSLEEFSNIQSARITKRWDRIAKGDLTNEPVQEKYILELMEILELREQKLTYKEISARIGLSESQIRQRVYRHNKRTKINS